MLLSAAGTNEGNSPNLMVLYCLPNRTFDMYICFAKCVSKKPWVWRFGEPTSLESGASLGSPMLPKFIFHVQYQSIYLNPSCKKDCRILVLKKNRTRWVRKALSFTGYVSLLDLCQSWNTVFLVILPNRTAINIYLNLIQTSNRSKFIKVLIRSLGSLVMK